MKLIILQAKLVSGSCTGEDSYTTIGVYEPSKVEKAKKDYKQNIIRSYLLGFREIPAELNRKIR